MSYYINQRDCDFVIKAKNMPKAYDALRELIDKGMQWPLYSIDEFRKSIKRFEYDVNFNREGDCVDIFKEGLLVYDEEILNSIAPYVEHGSFIEFEGEDGYLWRYVFTHGEMHEVSGKIVWEDDIL